MLFSLLGALLIGLSLGLLGSGGSIFTVPILHYGLGWDEKLAVAGSLFVVGAVSLFAALPQALAGRVRWRTVAVFGLPGMLGTFGGAFVSRWVPGPAQLGLFAVVMLMAAWLMRRPAPERDAAEPPRAVWKIAGDGLGVGLLTGLVGVGGGFMIVPALVLLGGLEMHAAVGTSLAIIALKSLTGFVEYLSVLQELELHLDWSVLGLFVGLGTLGSLAGGRLGAAVPQALLRKVFAVVLVVMALGILGAETLSAYRAEPPPAEAQAAPALDASSSEVFHP